MNHSTGHWRRAFDWLVIAAGTVGGGWLADRAGLPSGYLFAAMLVGLLYALIAPGRVDLPPGAFRVGQAVTGVALGSFVEASTLTALGWRWVPVIAVSVATLAVTIGAGILLARIADLDRPTASLGMVAGGASGIVAMAGELGGDDRIVAFMQYLRVLVVTLLTPLLVPIAFGIHSQQGGAGEGPILGSAAGWALTLGAGIAGAALGPRLRLPAPALLGPLILTAALTIWGITGDTQVPAVARETAFALIGLWIGLSFDRDTLRRIARLALPVAGSIAILLAACFALAWALELTAGVSLLDGYLATTPGGLYAVLPIAYGSGADTTFVLAVQSLRLFAMVLAAPVVVRWLIRSELGEELPVDPATADAMPPG
ncbi:MAG: AbrB family transcriptional regulator [Solirubrobacterales bacterium]